MIQGSIASAVRVTRAWRLHAVPFLFGVAWSGLLVCLAPHDVFFSADAGLKSLVIAQLATGDVSPELHFSAPAWVEQLWHEGYYPFAPPFVYETAAGRTVSFPFLFSLLCAPFHALGGLAAFALVPLLSLWLVWWRMHLLGRAAGLDRVSSTIAVALLVVATPLTLYGAMLWEHTLGVLLVSFGFHALFAFLAGAPSPREALLWGLGLGLAPWVRSETYALVALIALAIVVRARARGQLRCAALFVLTLALTLASLWLTNLALYGDPLGMHGAQVVGSGSGWRIDGAVARALRMSLELLAVAPPVALALLVPWLKRGPRPRDDTLCAQLLIAAVIGIALLVPNYGGRQVGPRYLLTLLPLACLLAARAVRVTTRRGRLLAAGTLALGALLHVALGTGRLLDDYRAQRRPALEALRAEGAQVVVVTDQDVAMELASLFGEKRVFLAGPGAQLATLADRLAERGIARFLWVTFEQVGFPVLASHTLAGRALACDRATRTGIFAYCHAEVESAATTRL